ncbi:hypothetical protein AAHE18_12G172100 [Arachis hypogaea]
MLIPAPSSSSKQHHDNGGGLPRWLQVLLTEKFYNACIVHEEAKKNEKNVYCLDCCITLCPHCLAPHRSHRLLQIRRYVYHDVIRLDDAAKLIDCTSVQSYTTNSAKVVFIKERAQTRNFRGNSGNSCSTCDRTLQDPYQFCSLSCKINYLIGSRGSLSGYLYECNYLPFNETGFDDGQLTTDSVLEPAGSVWTSSGSGGCVGGVDCKTTLACTATTEIVRKKRSSGSASCPTAPVCRPVHDILVGLPNRRKGTPQRAPLY